MNVNNVPAQMLCHCPPQHQRAHEDQAALQFTFYDVISAKPGAPAALRSLQSRCLIPGLYSTHLERWLTHYPANQVGTGTVQDTLALHAVRSVDASSLFLSDSSYWFGRKIYSGAFTDVYCDHGEGVWVNLHILPFFKWKYKQ